VSVAQHSMNAASQWIDSLLAQAPEGALACRAGCNHCCHQSVGVTPPEVLTIFTHLSDHRSEPELLALTERVLAADRATRGLSSEQRQSPSLPCPMLEEGRCSIYAVRPLSCRGVNSIDEQACVSKLYDEKKREAYRRGELPGHFYLEPVRAFHAMSAGLQLSLAEHFGLDMRPLDLNASLALLLGEWASRIKSRQDGTSGDGADCVTLWMNGLPGFEATRGGDATRLATQSAFVDTVGLLEPLPQES
jgi:Fe-S-cluster containining protein